MFALSIRIDQDELHLHGRLVQRLYEVANVYRQNAWIMTITWNSSN